MAERRVHRIVQGSSRNQWDDRRHQNRRRRCLQNSRPDLRVDRDQNRNHEKSQIFIIHKMQKRQINCPEDSAADRRDPEPLPPSSGPTPVRLFSGLSAPFFTFSRSSRRRLSPPTSHTTGHAVPHPAVQLT